MSQDERGFALPIHVINLDRAPERWAATTQGLSAQGLTARRFAAIDGQRDPAQVLVRYDEAASRRHVGAPQTLGTLACFASHYALWEAIAESDGPAVVLEDDLAYQEGFREALDLGASLIDRCRYLRLCALHRTRANQEIEALPGGFRLVRYRRRAIGSQAYLLSPTGARSLLRHAERWWLPVDDYLDAFWIHDLAALALMPFRVAHADAGASFIQGGTQPYRRSRLEYLRFKLNRRLDTLRAEAWLRRHPPGDSLTP
ncbi:MAG: hypothetical protein Kilf2KO_11480 [Rhodospirillales bacterium]